MAACLLCSVCVRVCSSSSAPLPHVGRLLEDILNRSISPNLPSSPRLPIVHLFFSNLIFFLQFPIPIPVVFAGLSLLGTSRSPSPPSPQFDLQKVELARHSPPPQLRRLKLLKNLDSDPPPRSLAYLYDRYNLEPWTHPPSIIYQLGNWTEAVDVSRHTAIFIATSLTGQSHPEPHSRESTHFSLEPPALLLKSLHRLQPIPSSSLTEKRSSQSGLLTQPTNYPSLYPATPKREQPFSKLCDIISTSQLQAAYTLFGGP